MGTLRDIPATLGTPRDMGTLRDVGTLKGCGDTKGHPCCLRDTEGRGDRAVPPRGR